jgi:DNA-binding transcriptional MerR regulator
MRIDYFRISDIAKRTGIPENTVREYTVVFDEFLTYATKGETKLYTPDALFIITRISQIYKTGKNTDEVKEALNKELPQLIQQKYTDTKNTKCA